MNKVKGRGNGGHVEGGRGGQKTDYTVRSGYRVVEGEKDVKRECESDIRMAPWILQEQFSNFMFKQLRNYEQ